MSDSCCCPVFNLKAMRQVRNREVLDFILFYFWIIKQKFHWNQAEKQQHKYSSKSEPAEEIQIHQQAWTYQTEK